MKSLVACFLILLLLTAPAVWMAPPNRRNFSVRVVLPASGWDMMAKVLRLLISLAYLFDINARKGTKIGRSECRNLTAGGSSQTQSFLHRIPDRADVIRQPKQEHARSIKSDNGRR